MYLISSFHCSCFLIILLSSLLQPTCYIAGQDFTSIAKILEFEPHITVKNVTISVTDDKVTEVDKTFVLYLSSGTGVFLAPFAQAEVTIINNDGRFLC